MANQFMELNLDCIEVRSNNTGAIETAEEEKQLFESIEQLGILSSVVVWENAPDKFQIIDGERRYRAANRLGLKKLLCTIVPRSLSDGDYELLRFQLNNTVA